MKNLTTLEAIEQASIAGKKYTKEYVDDSLPTYKTEVLTINTPAKAVYTLNIDQLTDRVGGTPVHITYVVGKSYSLPGNVISLGDTNITETADYEGVPYLNNENEEQSFTVNLSSKGDYFYLNYKSRFGIITGTNITFNMYSETTVGYQKVIVQYTRTQNTITNE